MVGSDIHMQVFLVFCKTPWGFALMLSVFYNSLLKVVRGLRKWFDRGVLTRNVHDSGFCPSSGKTTVKTLEPAKLTFIILCISACCLWSLLVSRELAAATKEGQQETLSSLWDFYFFVPWYFYISSCSVSKPRGLNNTRCIFSYSFYILWLKIELHNIKFSKLPEDI